MVTVGLPYLDIRLTVLVCISSGHTTARHEMFTTSRLLAKMFNACSITAKRQGLYVNLIYYPITFPCLSQGMPCYFSINSPNGLNLMGLRKRWLTHNAIVGHCQARAICERLFSLGAVV
jgi:hypothetical protein